MLILVLSVIALTLFFISLNLNNIVSTRQETNSLLRELATQVRYLKDNLRG